MPATIPLMFMETVKAHPTVVAQFSKDPSGAFRATTYTELLEQVKILAAGFLELGVRRGDHVGLISDNRHEWMKIDLAILGLGAADVPRGCDATEQELRYILDFSECALTVLENEKQLAKIVANKSGLPLLKTVVLLDPVPAEARTAAESAGLAVHDFSRLMELGAARFAREPSGYLDEVAKGLRDDLATLIYTSGTTGEPKGVMLSHGNFLYQTEQLPRVLDIHPGDIWLSVLPVWHSFERVLQYAILVSASSIAYSKPVGAIMLADMQAIHPQWMASVPRIWESVMDGVYRNINAHGGAKKALFDFFVAAGGGFAFFRNHLRGLVPDFRGRSRVLELLGSIVPFILLFPVAALGSALVFGKIKRKLGGRFTAGVSGGGALPPAVDRFFGAMGILVLEAYGLTETAPAISSRLQRSPVTGTVGPALDGTEVKIVDERGQALPAGHQGIIMVKGPQVMKGYYKKPELTARVLGADGWLDTGDLGMLTVNGEIRITGRAKDTIVLRGGENVEPAPIEQRILESPYIQQAIVLGQDQKFLAALFVPAKETLSAWATENGVFFADYESLLGQPEVIDLIDAEVNDRVNARHGFKSFERIFRFELLPEPFQEGRELSAKQEMKRHAINQVHAKRIARLFAD